MEKKWHALPSGCGYQIVRRLGSGGEGTVYLVCHLCTEQLRAAKILTHVRRDRLNELDMMKHLDHPSLPKIIDVLTQGEDVWLIMEYIRGRRLDSLARDGLSKRQIYEVAAQLSEVLLYLHSGEPPILHLDIKPSNLLIRPDGSLVLIDFGASVRQASYEEETERYGTRGFAAPEQFQKGSPVDVRTDIYGFGATVYYCRYGRAPEFQDDSRSSGRDPYRGPLQRIVRKCLALDPKRRFQDSRKLFQAVSRAKKNSSWCKWIVVPVFCLFASGILLLHSQESAATEKKTSEEREQKEEVRLISGTESAFETERHSETEAETETEDPDRKRQQYLRFLAMADGAGFSEAIKWYGKAAELFPADETWYLNLIKRVTADGLFGQEEEAVIRELFYEDISDETGPALELLKENPDSYGRVAYRMGLAYWYYYEGSGGKSAASWWFEQALQTLDKTEEQSWGMTAQIFSKIGNYYGMLERTSKEEEREEKECDYFRDLKDLWDLFTEQQEESGIRIETAKELLSLEILKAYELRCYGETREEMLRILSEVETLSASDALDGQEKKRGELEKQSADARAAVERAFQDRMGEDLS